MTRMTASLGGLFALALLPATAAASTYCTWMPTDEELAGIMSVDDPLVGGMSGISLAAPFRLVPMDERDSNDPALWCTSPDDPRCCPTNPPENPTFASSLELRFGGPELPTVAAPRAADVHYPSHESHPAWGVRSRVERPPRG